MEKTLKQVIDKFREVNDLYNKNTSRLIPKGFALNYKFIIFIIYKSNKLLKYKHMLHYELYIINMHIIYYYFLQQYYNFETKLISFDKKCKQTKLFMNSNRNGSDLYVNSSVLKYLEDIHKIKSIDILVNHINNMNLYIIYSSFKKEIGKDMRELFETKGGVITLTKQSFSIICYDDLKQINAKINEFSLFINTLKLVNYTSYNIYNLCVKYVSYSNVLFPKIEEIPHEPSTQLSTQSSTQSSISKQFDLIDISLPNKPYNFSSTFISSDELMDKYISKLKPVQNKYRIPYDTIPNNVAQIKTYKQLKAENPNKFIFNTMAFLKRQIKKIDVNQNSFIDLTYGIDFKLYKKKIITTFNLFIKKIKYYIIYIKDSSFKNFDNFIRFKINSVILDLSRFNYIFRGYIIIYKRLYYAVSNYTLINNL